MRQSREEKNRRLREEWIFVQEQQRQQQVLQQHLLHEQRWVFLTSTDELGPDAVPFERLGEEAGWSGLTQLRVRPEWALSNSQFVPLCQLIEQPTMYGPIFDGRCWPPCGGGCGGGGGGGGRGGEREGGASLSLRRRECPHTHIFMTLYESITRITSALYTEPSFKWSGD